MSEENTNIPRFIGESTNSVDSKGRIFVPTKWRSQLNETMILHAGFGRSASGRYLELTTVDNFNKLIAMINALPPSEKRFESLKRVIFRNSEEVSADKQGRILIPKRLIEHACLKSEIIMTGAGDHIEIWDPDMLDTADASYSHDSLMNDFELLNAMLTERS